MTETTETSGSVRIGGVLGILGLVAAVSVGAIALGSTTPAGAEGLERFESCTELQNWSTSVSPVPVLTDLGGAPTTAVASEEAARASDGAAAAPVADTGSGASAGASGAGGGAGGGEAFADTDQAADASAGGRSTGGTNTVVEGVDEIDVIDRIGDDRLLVSRNGALALVDLSGRTVVAELKGLAYDARISVDGDLVWVAGSVFDPNVQTEVRRVRVEGDTLVEDGTWRMPGGVIDARRTRDTLQVVAVDYPINSGGIAFDGGPVPCDQVWRPVAPATDPGATMVVSLPADGPLEPLAAAEVTGSAGNLLVTDSAVYIATQSYDAEQFSTGVHRFSLDGLTLTGSGTVPGAIAGPFALNEYEGHLRVATNAGFGFGVPIEGDVIVDSAEAVGTDAAVAPETEGDVNALAEVFVLDLDGDLDVVGRTGRFGHDNETIQGVRFVGDTAYVVTFMQTDPFWVLDLTDPAAPSVVGELQIPGFSGYLHPVADGLVVGLGPDGNGATSARLFDVADPANPSVVDELVLGDDSSAAYDHHAFVGMGDGHFAVPFTDYPEYREVTECESPIPMPMPEPRPIDPPTTTVPPDSATSSDSSGSSGSAGASTPGSAGAGTDSVGGVVEPGIAVAEPYPYCPPEPIGGAVGAIELEVADGHLVEVDRASAERGDASAERVVRAADGTWLVLSWDRLIPTDGGEDLVLPTA